MDVVQIAMILQVGAQDIDSSAVCLKTDDVCAFPQSFGVVSALADHRVHILVASAP